MIAIFKVFVVTKWEVVNYVYIKGMILERSNKLLPIPLLFTTLSIL